MPSPIVNPQGLGSELGIAAATPAPTLVTEGFPANKYRFINLWVGITGFTSIMVGVYYYKTPPAGATTLPWVRDVTAVTILGTAGGQLMEFEPRGPERIYLRVESVVGGPGTVDITAEGVTY